MKRGSSKNAGKGDADRMSKMTTHKTKGGRPKTMRKGKRG